MTERDFETALLNLLEALDDEDVLDVIHDDEIATSVMRASTFEDCGIATRNKGLVVRMKSGDEFQITIVQSWAAPVDDDDESEDES